MPPRKEPKETVVYPASKRKAPPFKPQRPSKVPRIPTTGSESTKPQRTTKPTAPPKQKSAVRIEDNDEDVEVAQSSVMASADKSDSEEALDDDPLAAKRKTKNSNATESAAPNRKISRQPSSASIFSQQSSNASPDSSDPPAPDPDPPPSPSQSEGTLVIPQPLLVRLLHEHFADKKTKIDKHAIQVLQKYFEVFVREAIARAQLEKREAAEKAGASSEADANWLELPDLEKVAAGMLLDF